MKKIDHITPIIIFTANIYFLPLSIYILFTGGGPMGFAYFALPFCLLINLFLIPSFLFYKKNKNIERSIIANRIGAAFILLVLVTSIILINL